MKPESKVPRIPHTFFKWYCRLERYEELHGDLEELFYERVEQKGLLIARMLYTLDVIRCCQPYAWKTQRYNGKMSVMIYKNYFKISSRVLMKNPMSSFINILGLSISIAICVSIYGLHRWMFSKDEFHQNRNEVYLATYFADLDGSMQQIGTTPRPLGEMLAQDFTEIKRMCRVDDRNVVMKKENNVFPERIRFVDKSFLEMLTFPLKWGTAASLGDINSIILSEEMSTKYFGDDNPIGNDIQVIFSEGINKQFKVTGVAEGFPESRSFEFSALINFENVRVADPDHNINDWGAFISATIIQVDDVASLNRIKRGMEKYRKIQNEAQDDWIVSSFGFEPLATL
jgi:putative ABC transport system permease protein